jgi:organic hydroperoxide reductase OsmC/OhrA
MGTTIESDVQPEALMHPYPHLYTAGASGAPTGNIAVTSPRLPGIATAPPAEFDGPGDVWSPETLLCASIADCFILTFRAIAKSSGIAWSDLGCRVEGVLERADGISKFTRYTTYATLKVAPGSDVTKARSMLQRSEHLCLVANSLQGTRTLVAEVLEVG